MPAVRSILKVFLEQDVNKFQSLSRFCPVEEGEKKEVKLEDVLMITSGNNASKNECPTVGTDESYKSYESY